jgi:hypothetical protein
MTDRRFPPPWSVDALCELLEARGEQDKYLLLRMFCDWSLHTNLGRSKAGNQLLDILDAMWAKSKTVDEQFRDLLEGISPARFQTEIASLLARAYRPIVSSQFAFPDDCSPCHR